MSSTDREVLVRYCRTDTIRFAAGDQMQLIYAKLNRSVHLLAPNLINLLDHCWTFRTLDQHAEGWLRAHVNESQPRELNPVAPIHDLLLQLIEAGLLISDRDLLDQVRRLTHASTLLHPPASISTIGVLTRDRPDSLRRCLTSYIENGKRHGRACRFVVMDDSQSVEMRNHIRQMLGELRARCDVNLAYAGREEKKGFAAALAAAGDVPCEVIDFALFGIEELGCTVGANRNALLLDTPGELVCSVDDDTVCHIAQAPQMQTELAFDAAWEAMKFWFFPNRASATSAVSFVEGDVLALHEQLLGRDLRQCAATFESEVNNSNAGWHFDEVNARSLRDLQHNRGRVLATFTGIVGDSGLHSPVNYLLLSGDSRQRLIASEEDYLTACTSREVIRAIDRPRVSANAWCVTTVYGFDNRRVLPPFMPMGWGEDDVWGFTMQTCCEDGYFGYLPWLVEHAPPETRIYPPDSITKAATLRNFQILLACLASFQIPPGPVSDSERMQALGRHLIALGEMEQLNFEEHLRLHIWRRQSEYISYLESLLRVYGGTPEFWASAVRHHIAALRAAFAQPDHFIAQDLRINRSNDEARRFVQQSVQKFGLLLYWWPRLVTVAKTLRDKGQRLAAAI
ncbi:MAG: hypothetical protein H0T92_20700 [Pyrinomonadaceae bacterium]|nr:hypothetical protein [Pyrinomonadaceae bacterium]